jgi:2-dehydro-3-deoxyphosphogluconate aldolase/(4S)-4-hydroxy-2-oxoglutarate aldolase
MTTPAAVSDQLAVRGIVPVIAIEDPAHAPHLGRALVEGGLPVAEITFRTEGAAAAITSLRDAEPTVAVGAGTVLTTDQVDAAARAGAQFVVTPGLNPAVVDRCRELGLPIVPGVNTPTHVEQAMSLGLTTLKLFPAVPSGGLALVKALAAPYPMVSFMATGGITLKTAPEWLAQPTIVAVGGTWVATAADIAAERFDVIESNARAAAALLAPAR